MATFFKLLVFGVIPLIILLLFSVFLLHLGTIGGFFANVLFIATAMNQYAGVNLWLARSITAPILFVAYYYGLRYILVGGKNRVIGYVSLIAVWSLACVSMYATQGSFSRKTGEALQYYLQDERGQIILRDHSGVDAETGKKLQPVTPDTIRLYRLQQQGGLKVADNTLFDPQTGKPLKRYYKAPTGKIELFPLEVQYHPQTGASLELLTPEIAKQLHN